MGRHFGDLAKIRHVITYSISPFEQRAFPNYFSKGIPNVWRRFKSSVFKVAPRKSFWDKIKRCTGFFFFFLKWLNFCTNLHLYLQLWFLCTWPTHGAIMCMNRAKERTPQTTRMTSEIAPLKRCPCVTFCFCTIHQ